MINIKPDTMKLFVRYLLLAFIAFLISINYSCEEDEKDDTPKITCSANCSTMSWEIIGETGQRTYSHTCNLDWTGNNYIETCTGTVTYDNSGNTYNYTVIYDWIDCEIDVSVNGKASCSDATGIAKSKQCDCQVSVENAYIKYKSE